MIIHVSRKEARRAERIKRKALQKRRVNSAVNFVLNARELRRLQDHHLKWGHMAEQAQRALDRARRDRL